MMRFGCGATSSVSPSADPRPRRVLHDQVRVERVLDGAGHVVDGRRAAAGGRCRRCYTRCTCSARRGTSIAIAARTHVPPRVTSLSKRAANCLDDVGGGDEALSPDTVADEREQASDQVALVESTGVVRSRSSGPIAVAPRRAASSTAGVPADLVVDRPTHAQHEPRAHRPAAPLSRQAVLSTGRPCRRRRTGRSSGAATSCMAAMHGGWMLLGSRSDGRRPAPRASCRGRPP